MSSSKNIIICLFICFVFIMQVEAREMTSSAKRILKFLSDSSTSSPLLGHQDALLYGQNWWIGNNDSLYEKSDVYDVSGQYPFILGLDLSMIENGTIKNFDGCLFRQMKEAAIVHYKRGGIVTISWHMFNPLTGGNAWDKSRSDVVYQILTNDSIKKTFFLWLDRGAEFMNQLEDENGQKIPILFRPFHECNIKSFWWSGNMCTDKEYVNLWKLVYDYYVNKKKMNQLLWVYSPYNIQTRTEIHSKYPGNKYVDIIGYERYQLGAKTYQDGAKRFVEGVSKGLDVTISYAKKRKKIVAFTECGFPGIPYDKWWTDALGKAIEGKSISYLLLWRNGVSKNRYHAPCPISKSNSNFFKFVKMCKIQMLEAK